MICVTIARNRHRMMIAEHRALAEQGAALAELRLDWLTRAPRLKRLLTDRPTPVIITCRREQDGGKYTGGEEQRLAILRQAVADGADFVDLEEDVAASIPRYGKTRRIVSYHNFDETPADLAAVHARLAAQDADIVKLATRANSPGDNVRMLQLVAGSKKPTVGLCMGDLGVPSRVLACKFGSPFTFASAQAGGTVAPGMLSFDELRNVYRLDEIHHETQLYGVVGDPVAHSLSPLLHNRVFAELKLSNVYLPFRISAGRLAESLEALDWLQVRGFSVTIPHKEEAAALADQPDESVRAVGAANTLVRTEGGGWRAFNTDYQAALESLEAALDGGGDDGSPLKGMQVLLLGAGGAARAIAHGLVRHGANVTIAGRTPKRAEELARAAGCSHVPWAQRTAQPAEVLINATPVGMHPNVDESPVDASFLRADLVVFDTVYHPEETLLLKQARQRGARTVSGVEMFVRQAAAQVRHFTGHDAPERVMRQALADWFCSSRS